MLLSLYIEQQLGLFCNGYSDILASLIGINSLLIQRKTHDSSSMDTHVNNALHAAGAIRAREAIGICKDIVVVNFRQASSQPDQLMDAARIDLQL